MEHKPMTAKELKKQGSCCGSGCKNCPYIPRHQKGSIMTMPDKFNQTITNILKAIN